MKAAPANGANQRSIGMNRFGSFSLLVLLSLFVIGFAQEQPLYFILLTDTQFGMYSANKDFAQEAANLEFAVATVNRLKPAFVAVLGDLVNQPGNAAQIGEYLRIEKKIDSSIPVHHVAGNHDVGNEPTPQSLADYRRSFGKDYYSFRSGPIYGIVINTTLIHKPQKAMAEYEAQQAWLEKELAAASKSGARHTILFQHHPCFLKSPAEPDEYMNIPLERRGPMLKLLNAAGVQYVFAGHHHQTNEAEGGGLHVIVTAPVGMPLGQQGSGMRIVGVRGSEVTHKYYDFGFLPAQLSELYKKEK
jgi:serine/threonine-protein phosphatase CPPED1